MGETTAISWCDHTFNPWWGCMKVSPGCTNCYALTLSKRVGFDIWGPPATTARRLFGPKHWAEPLKWNAAAEREGVGELVFCASMADVFEDHPLLPPEREKLWALIERTPWLVWQLLTKRPEHIAQMVPAIWLVEPRPNVWYGTSVEDQERADERIPKLLGVPATVRFLSCEPLLGPVDLRNWLRVYGHSGPPCCIESDGWHGMTPPEDPIGWVIAGGESGPKHRPFNPQWARALRDQCRAAGVAFFFKQVGGRTHAEGGDLLDGARLQEFPTAWAVTA